MLEFFVFGDTHNCFMISVIPDLMCGEVEHWVDVLEFDFSSKSWTCGPV